MNLQIVVVEQIHGFLLATGVDHHKTLCESNHGNQEQG